MFKTKKIKHLNSGIEDITFQQVFKKKNVILVAPGSGISLEKLEAIRLLQHHINLHGYYDISTEIPYHANTDQYRFLQFKQAVTSKNDIIWALRGGYGSARIIPWLEKMPIPKNKKIFIGYSDNTALHLFLTQRWNWQTIHGEGISGLFEKGKDPLNFIKIAEIISAKEKYVALTDLKPLNEEAQLLKRITGYLTGGNLTLIQTSIGTSWQVDAKNKILFLEDRGEEDYKVDRTLVQLKQANILKNVKAIIFGNFVESGNELNFALQRFANETNIPVFKTNQFGHADVNYPLIYNAKSILMCKNNDYSLEITTKDR